MYVSFFPFDWAEIADDCNVCAEEKRTRYALQRVYGAMSDPLASRVIPLKNLRICVREEVRLLISVAEFGYYEACQFSDTRALLFQEPIRTERNE